MANIDFPSGAPFVSRIMPPSEFCDRLEKYSNQVIEVLDMEYGVTHLECFHTENDELVFCEIAARPGGGGIVWMMEAYSGINYSRASLFLEAGQGEHIKFPKFEIGCETPAMMGFRWPENNFVKAIADQAHFNEAWVNKYDQCYSVGDFVASCSHCTDYVGLLIFTSPNVDVFNERQKNLYNRFYINLQMHAV
jgi:hypothetical protein